MGLPGREFFGGKGGFLPPAGIDAPTPARKKGLQPYGTLDCFEWRSEGGAGGERREARAQWAQPPKAVSAPEFRQTTSGAHGSANRADCLPRGKPPCIASMGNNFAVSNSPWRGLTRRLRRGLGLAVPRGAHTFLSVAKEKCAKESQRHGDSGKKPFIAHF